MKFFSNDAKENTDDDRDRGDVVTSDPVTVPQQRAGSPWNDAPGTPEDELADREQRDGTETETENAWGYGQEAEPATTTYGPDGTVTPAEPSDTTEEARADDEALKDEGTFDSPEAVDPDTGEKLDETDLSDRSETEPTTLEDTTTDTEAESDTDPAVETDAMTAGDDRLTAEDDRVDADRAGDETEADETDEAAAERDEERAELGEPAPVDPTTGETFDETAHDTTTTDDTTDETVDEPETVAVVDEPEPVDTVDGHPVDAETADAAPVVAAVPVETTEPTADATPGSVAEPTLDRLFPAGDSFAERFREIQLGFVDTPKESAAKAADLVAEAVQAITTALNERKDALAADSDDTENLRVQLRGYRDLLGRITGL